MKKVSKYENKFAKLQKKAAEFNFRNQLKVVKKKEFTLEEEDKEVSLPYFPLKTQIKSYIFQNLQKPGNPKVKNIGDFVEKRSALRQKALFFK